MTDYGLVSIITPNYKCGRFIGQTIESVQAQTYQNWELLIQDDCSPDDSVVVAMQYAEKDSRIKIQANGINSGAAVSRNNAIKRAKGKWIAFLDSDDLWTPDKLEKQLKFMVENNYHFSYHFSDSVNEDGSRLLEITRGPKKVTNIWMRRYCWIGCLTAMYDAEHVGLIQINDIKKNNDYAIWLKVIKKADCYCLPEVLARYRIRGGSISRNSKFSLIKWHYKLFRDAEEMAVIPSLYCCARNLFWGVIRKMKYIEHTDQEIKK